MAVDAPAGIELTSINIDSASGIFTGSAAENCVFDRRSRSQKNLSGNSPFSVLYVAP